MAAETSGRPAPRSWAEDLNTYRDARGAKSFGTVASGADVPKRYSRTNYAPLGAERHPLVAYDMFKDHGGRVVVDREVQADREARHGWGDTSLIKEEGFEPGTLHRSCRASSGHGRARVPAPGGGEERMFGVLQQTGAGAGGGPDSWIGNSLIDPTKGKRVTPGPTDPKGRRDLFDVLNNAKPGVPSDDSWMGNALIDPARGKAKPPGPEELRGRRDLNDVMQQSLLRESEQRRFELLQRGGDLLSDGWVGNGLIDPNKGKAAVQSKAAEDVMHGATFKRIPSGHTDFPRPHQMQVPPPVEDVMREVLDGSSTGRADWGKLGRRPLSEPKGGARPVRQDHLYAHMTYRDLSSEEKTTFARTMDDGKLTSKRIITPVPGSQEHGKGPDMLQWKPNDTLAQFVPYGKLAQQTRTTRKADGWR